MKGVARKYYRAKQGGAYVKSSLEYSIKRSLHMKVCARVEKKRIC